jgi:hypothetical protein
MSVLRTATLVLLISCSPLLIASEAVTESPPTAAWREQAVTLSNGTVEVIADALHGGRLIAYGPAGGNVLYDDLEHPAWLFPDNVHWTGPSGGRFDLGPEEVLPAHPTLWTGTWTATRPGPLRARLTSQADPAVGLQLIRDIVLDADGTRLRCTQTMRNITDLPLRRSYWGRSLVRSGGITVVPLNPDSRFPNGYVTYSGWQTNQISMKPKDPAVTIRDGHAIVSSALNLKLGFDGTAGWIAYLMPNGTMFLKRYAVYPERRYTGIAGLTASLWSDGKGLLEIEPLGPEELLKPGESASFSEEWWLLPYPFPGEVATVDPVAVARFIEQHAPATR